MDFTNKKQINFATTQHQIEKRNLILTNFPYLLSLDPSSTCNLKCKFCPTAANSKNWPKTQMPFDGYKMIIDELGPYLQYIEFGNWGEPLCSKDIYSMIKYAKKYGIKCIMNSNFHNINSESCSKLISAGLDILNISIDGLSQKTYEKYRIGGDLGKVLQNLETLIIMKNKMNSKTPKIQWQFLVFKHNEHEISAAKEYAENLGVDKIRFSAPWIYDIKNNCEEWLSSQKEYNRYAQKGTNISYKQHRAFCKEPWFKSAISANGSVFPCCSDIEEDLNLGNIFKDSFEHIWNGKKYQQTRRYIINSNSDEKTCCKNCLDIKQTKSL